MERLLLFIFWLQLLVAQIVVVGDLVAAVARAVALLVEQPARIQKDLLVSVLDIRSKYNY